jgi:AcrR family transcriptional regulator
MPKLERGKVRVEVLPDAAAFLFGDRDNEATTMTEIAVRAEASIGSLHQLFPSKVALAEALLPAMRSELPRPFMS